MPSTACYGVMYPRFPQSTTIIIGVELLEQILDHRVTVAQRMSSIWELAVTSKRHPIPEISMGEYACSRDLEHIYP